ncbi:hypothetical protein AB0L75_05085 [Streptomyces sp. NPDC052101]|uniref:hypothetical protein n=1 Tax=Streptomyces sp. NPDC052101 TaxID=3155763 RepID=UPI003434402E
MLTETTGRTPQDLATELATLREVDWASVWAGPPQSGSELREWCGRYGWEPLTFDRQLRVRTTSGGELSFGNTTTYGSPLVRASLLACWRVTASGPQDNGAVLAAASEAWPVHLQAAVSAMGAPVWHGQWDAEDFPEPSDPAFWEARESRLANRSPFRMAYWAPVGEAPGQAVYVLDQSVSFPTWTEDLPGGSMISLAVYPPEGSRRNL